MIEPSNGHDHDVYLSEQRPLQLLQQEKTTEKMHGI